MESYTQFILVMTAFLIDVIMGDPRWFPHPVIGMGKVISTAEKLLNKGTALNRKLKGMFLTVVLVLGAFILTQEFIRIIRDINSILGWGIEAFLISTTLAGKSLSDAGRQITRALKEEDLSQARQKLQWLVSRDPSKLRESEIVRGTVESIFENFVDGFLSPFLFALIGGAPLAMAFKAVSTLDSMIGYRNERYKDFGWFAARTDDWSNYIPARISVFILLGAGIFYRMPIVKAFGIWKRDAKKHPSPNGGNPESIGAGLLGVKLGGLNVYEGRTEYRAEMGEALNPLTYKIIEQSLNVIGAASWLTWGLAALSVLLMF